MTDRPRVGFFLAAHVTLLVIVLLGFGPSFYLRPAFVHHTKLPLLLIIHGLVLTVWFVLAVVQGWLIRTHRRRLHRRLGYIAAGYAALVIVLGILANLRLITEIDSPADGENVVIWANFITLTMFAAFVALAVIYRTNREAHRRLTLLASISIVGPALARLPRWPMFAGGLEAGRNYAIGGLLVLFALLIIHDIIVRRRPHSASVAGMAAILIGIAASVFLGVTGIGFRILHS